MNSKIKNSIVSGTLATAIMTVVMILGTKLGMPEMNPAGMLAAMLGVPSLAGWILHLLIGITFAALYIYLFHPRVKISNTVLKGLLYGVVVFIFAQIGFGILGAVASPPPAPDGSMALLMVGSVLGHFVYGIAVALFTRA